MFSTSSSLSIHLYLHLVNESGDSLIEQEMGFLLVDWICYPWFSEVSDNPNTAGKPRSINPFPYDLQMLFT